jgi:transcriptional regulator with XRE-family HTH domain
MIRLSRTVSQRSIRDVAREIGTSPATLMRIEHGEAFDVATLMRLLAWLLGEDVPNG